MPAGKARTGAVASPAPGNGKPAASALPQIRVAAAVVQWKKFYLITQRRDAAVMPRRWEFPGGRVEAGESDADALKRTLHERLDVAAEIGELLAERHTDYADYGVTLALYAATLNPATPIRMRRVRDFRWVRSRQFDDYQFPDADQNTMDQLLGLKP